MENILHSDQFSQRVSEIIRDYLASNSPKKQTGEQSSHQDVHWMNTPTSNKEEQTKQDNKELNDLEERITFQILQLNLQLEIIRVEQVEIKENSTKYSQSVQNFLPETESKLLTQASIDTNYIIQDFIKKQKQDIINLQVRIDNLSSELNTSKQSNSVGQDASPQINESQMSEQIQDLHSVMIKLQQCFDVFIQDQQEFVHKIESFNGIWKDKVQQNDEQNYQINERLNLIWQGLDFLSTEYWNLQPPKQDDQKMKAQLQAAKKRFILF